MSALRWSRLGSGRRATSSGRPCRVTVALFGDACPRHAEIESELPVYEKP